MVIITGLWQFLCLRIDPPTLNGEGKRDSIALEEDDDDDGVDECWGGGNI